MTTLTNEYSFFANKFSLYATSEEKKPPVPAAASLLTPEVKRKVDLMLLVGEECQTQAELELVMAKKPNPICYDGFEPSGRMHIAQGVFKAVNVNRCAAAGCTFVFWVADWFALMNDKMGGELEKIQTVGKYFIEVWRASGMDMSAVRFQWASEDINKNANEYWMRVLDIGRKSSISRITKCCQIMGRKEGTLTAAQILYPLMQCTDIFFLKADVCQLGLDQRKVNMLARDYCDQIGRKLKPIILSHHMLQGLKEDRDEEGNLKKMSKSDPDSAVFMEDSEADVNRKIMNAYCPPCVKDNPCLDYVRNIVFGKQSEFMGYTTYASVEAAYLANTLSEKDMKTALAAAVNSYVAPVRKHFETDPTAKALLQKVRDYKKEAPAPALKKEVAAAPFAPHCVAWVYPTPHMPLTDVLHIVTSLNAAVESGAAATLLLADWTGFATNHIVGEEKDVAAVLEYASACVAAYGLSPKVNIVKQSAVILKDSDAYWIGVIEVGRKFMLSDVEAAWGQTLECAGQVISVLMHVSDVATLQATEVVGGYSGVTPGMNDLAQRFVPGLTCRNASATPIPLMSDPATAVTDVSEQTLLCDDTEPDMKKKIKRAYGPPDIAGPTNPLLPLAGVCIALTGSLKVSRPVDLGGEKSFSSVSDVTADYAAKALHPGDLKTAITPPLLAVSAKCREMLGGAAGKKMTTALKVVEKKQAKK